MPASADGAEALPAWEVTAKRKLQIQTDTIAPFARLTSPLQSDEITAIDDAQQLARLIAERSFTAFDVTLAYIQRAAKAHERAGRTMTRHTLELTACRRTV